MDRSVFSAIQRVGSIFILRFYIVHFNIDTLSAKIVIEGYGCLDDIASLPNCCILWKLDRTGIHFLLPPLLNLLP